MTHERPAWRLLDTGASDGPANMALDEALLTCFDSRSSQPVLRLYGWDPPALSIGRYQDAAAALRLDLCQREEIPVVRRMTGGGIIFHARELTYSIICSPSQVGDVTGVKEGFRRFCGFLLGAYTRLGLPAAFAVDQKPAGERLGERTSFCFAGKEEYDLLVAGRKIGGNAQRRMRGVIMQHGSIPLESRVSEALRYLKEPAPGAEAAVSLAELGVRPDLGALKQTIVDCFEDALSVRLEGSRVSVEEGRAAALLEREKYRSDRWNVEGMDQR